MGQGVALERTGISIETVETGWRQGGDSNGALGRRDKGTSIMGTPHDGGGFHSASSSGVPKIESDGRVIWAGGEGEGRRAIRHLKPRWG